MNKKKLLTTITLVPLFALSILAGEFTTGTASPKGGSNGDVYFETNTGQLWQKQSGTWSILVSRFGSKGDKGDRGESGSRGVAGPAGPSGPSVRTFASDTLRNAAAPQFVNQLALTLPVPSPSPGTPARLHFGSGTGTGNWTAIPTVGPSGASGSDLVVISQNAGTATDARTTPHLLLINNQSNVSDLTVTMPTGDEITIGASSNPELWMCRSTTQAFRLYPSEGDGGSLPP